MRIKSNKTGEFMPVNPAGKQEEQDMRKTLKDALKRIAKLEKKMEGNA